MNHQPVKRRLLSGTLLGLFAAYVWAVLILLFYASQEQWLGLGVLGVAAYAVAMATWLVLPMGAVIGYIFPPQVINIASTCLFNRVAVTGLACGLTASLCTAAIEMWPNLTGRAVIIDHAAWQKHEFLRFGLNFASMSMVSCFCLGAWALIIRKQEAEQGGAPNAHPRHAGMLARFARGIRRATGERG